MKKLAFTLLAVLCASHVLAAPQDDGARRAASDTKPKAADSQAAPSCGTQDPHETVPENILDIELRDLDAQTFRLSDFKGRVLVLNFWATWCGPCRREVYELNAVNTDYASRNVAVVGLSVEKPEADVYKVRSFMQQYGLNYRVGWSNKEVFCTLSQCDTCIPQTFIISASGRIVKRLRGFDPSLAPSVLRDAVEQALKEDEAAKEK